MMTYENKIICDEIFLVLRSEFEKQGIELKKIYLFGSRSTDKAEPKSDWDILVIINKSLNFMQRWDLIDILQNRFIPSGIRTDLIIRSEDQINIEKNDTGRITYYALRDGILLS